MADQTKSLDLDARLAERRGRAGLVRDLTDGVQGRPRGERVFLSPLRWLLAIGMQLAVVAGVVLAILAVPPLLACHERGQGGFYAGETFGTCAAQGLSLRTGEFEQRIRKLIRGSGR